MTIAKAHIHHHDHGKQLSQALKMMEVVQSLEELNADGRRWHVLEIQRHNSIDDEETCTQCTKVQKEIMMKN